VVAVGTSLADKDVASLKTQLETLLPEAQVSDYREANASLTKALDGATGLLSLMSLVALVLGAVGVAMAMRAHLQQRLDSIAIMKSLGAGTAQVMKIYVIQTVMLGLGGGVLGVVMGLGVQAAFPLFLAKLLHLTPAVRLDAHAVGLGLTAGLLTTLLFTLPPLLDIRGVRPILILRRNVEEPARSVGEWVRTKLRSLPVQLTTSVIILGGLLWLAYRVSDSLKVGGIFAAGLGGALLVLLVMAWLTLLLLKLFLRGTRLHLPSVLRHGLANLYRPGNPSAALLAALGLGVMQIAAVYMVQRSIVNEMQVAVADKVPNLFLIDMTSDEVGGIKRLLGQQPSVQGTPEIVPVVGARLTLVNGAKPERLQEQREGRGDRDGRSAYGVSLTWAPDAEVPPPGDKVENGAWWTAAQAAASVKTPLVAVERGRAERLKAKVGDTITFAIQDQTITATVAATYEADSQHSFSRAEFVMPEPMLEGMPVVWYGGVHCKPGATGELRRALYETFPTVTVIDVAATLEVIRQVLLQITYVIQFLAAFSIFAGIVILASAIAGTKYRRVREVVVLKTLGATRTRIAAIFSVEFAVLGLIAGAVGLVFANLLARGILHSLHFEYGFQPLFTLAAWLTTSVLTVAAGWIASYRVLGQKPLEVLREE
jgi:putative ABC transport system permease protein